MGVCVNAPWKRAYSFWSWEQLERDLMVVIVEKRDIDAVVVHGSLAGLAAGLVLGLTTVIGSFLLTGSGTWPFRFAAAFVAGPDALRSDFPLGAALLLGGAIHFALAAGFGFVFVGLLSLTYQLSARAWLLVIYGSIFGFVIWELDFLVAVPTFFPFLASQIDLATQLWNGVLSYVFIFGPVLALYVIAVRPSVVDDWHAVGAPAGTFTPPAGTLAPRGGEHGG
jgi:hypothetical protein